MRDRSYAYLRGSSLFFELLKAKVGFLRQIQTASLFHAAQSDEKMNTQSISNRIKVAVLGATGMVGRRLADLLVAHPAFDIAMLVGSSETAGLSFRSVWERKEQDLQDHYGPELWARHAFPDALGDIRVFGFHDLLASDIEVVFSSIPGRAGDFEEQLLRSGRTVFSNSPYRRFDNDVALIVPEVNRLAIQGRKLVKNPNCVTSGLVIVLQPIVEEYGIQEVVVTTYQSLSGRGDAKYGRSLVVGNILPLHGSEENTEDYIRRELNKILGTRFRSSITCNRTCVQTGHFVEVRIKTLRPVDGVNDVERLLSDYNPLKGVEAGTNPESPMIVIREQGRPRPMQDIHHHGGMAIAVGNISTNDEVFDLRMTYVVNNLVRGAAGGALLNAEIWLLGQEADGRDWKPEVWNVLSEGA